MKKQKLTTDGKMRIRCIRKAQKHIDHSGIPIDKQKAQIICQNVFLKTFLGKQPCSRIYCRNSAFKELGAGIYLFSVLLALLLIAFLVLGVVSVVPMVLNSRGGYSDPNNKMDFLTKLTYGNMKRIRSIDYAALKIFMAKYLQKIQDDAIFENQSGTSTVAPKAQSGNTLGAGRK